MKDARIIIGYLNNPDSSEIQEIILKTHSSVDEFVDATEGMIGEILRMFHKNLKKQD